MAKGRFKLNSPGVEQLLKDMEPVVGGCAEAIAEAAGAGFRHESSVGHSRALAMVWAGDWRAVRAESSRGALSRAISAGNI